MQSAAKQLLWTPQWANRPPPPGLLRPLPTTARKALLEPRQLTLPPTSSPQEVPTDFPLWIMTTKPFYRPAKPLTILQANVGRGATSHEIALSLAHDSLIDIILIQE